MMLLGPKLLDKPPLIELSNRNSRVEPCLSMSVPVGLVSRRSTRIITDKENQETTKETSQENALMDEMWVTAVMQWKTVIGRRASTNNFR